MMKKIFILGYWNCNFGDDLMLTLFLDHFPNLKKRFILVTTKQYSNIYKRNYLIKTFVLNSLVGKIINKIGLNINKPDFYRNLLLKNQEIIYLIGSGFIQIKEFPKYFPLKTFKNRKIVFGSNFGPYFTDEYLKQAKETFEKCELVSFRDSKSFSLFNSLPNVSLTPDIGFSLRSYSNQKNEIIIVIPFGPLKFSDKNAYNDYINASKEKIKTYANLTRQVVFISFNDCEKDFITCELLATIFNNSKTIKYDGQNLNQILDLINESKYIISSRHHGCVLGLLYKANVYPLYVDSKTTVLLNDVARQHEDGHYYCDDRQLKLLHKNTEQEFSKLSKILNQF